MKRKYLFFLFIIPLFLASLLYFYHKVTQEYLLDIDSFIIEAGDSSRNICHNLKSLFNTPEEICLITVKFNNYNLKFGEFEFKGKYSLISVLNEIQAGKVKRYYITIPEGFTNQQIYKILEQHPKLNGEIIKNYPEGSFLPETYDFTLNFNRNKLLKRMNEAQLSLILNLKPSLPIEFILNIASIIEKEAKLDNERSLISSVYHNRIKKNMLLQADPTLIYDIRKGADFNYTLTRKDIDKNESGYNSYKFPGLPPTPICNPGKAAIVAAIKPAETNYLYFVSNNQGGHNFSSTLSEHNGFVRAYRQGK